MSDLKIKDFQKVAFSSGIGLDHGIETDWEGYTKALKKQAEEAHDHALWEAEMMSNILLSSGSHIAISKVYFNGLFNDENYRDREPTLTTHESSTITKAKFESLEKQVKELKKGVCPKCGISMFDEFSFSIHSVANCGKRRAVAQNTEFA